MKGKKITEIYKKIIQRDKNWKYDNRSTPSKDYNRRKLKCNYYCKLGHKENECYNMNKYTESKLDKFTKKLILKLMLFVLYLNQKILIRLIGLLILVPHNTCALIRNNLNH